MAWGLGGLCIVCHVMSWLRGMCWIKRWLYVKPDVISWYLKVSLELISFLKGDGNEDSVMALLRLAGANLYLPN